MFGLNTVISIANTARSLATGAQTIVSSIAEQPAVQSAVNTVSNAVERAAAAVVSARNDDSDNAPTSSPRPTSRSDNDERGSWSQSEQVETDTESVSAANTNTTVSDVPPIMSGAYLTWPEHVPPLEQPVSPIAEEMILQFPESIETETELSTENEAGPLRTYLERIVPSLGATKVINSLLGNVARDALNAVEDKFGWAAKIVSQGALGSTAARVAWPFTKYPQDVLERELFGVEPADPVEDFFDVSDWGPGYMSALASIKTADAITNYLGPVASQTMLGSAKVLMGSTIVSSGVFVVADATAHELLKVPAVREGREDVLEFFGKLNDLFTDPDVQIEPDLRDFIGPDGQVPEHFDEWHIPTDPAGYLAVYNAYHGIDPEAEAAEEEMLYEAYRVSNITADGMPRADAVTFKEFQERYWAAERSLLDLEHPGDDGELIRAWLDEVAPDETAPARGDVVSLGEALNDNEYIEVSTLPPAPALLSGTGESEHIDVATLVAPPPTEPMFTTVRLVVPEVTEVAYSGRFSRDESSSDESPSDPLTHECHVPKWLVKLFKAELGEDFNPCVLNDASLKELSEWLTELQDMPPALPLGDIATRVEPETGLPLVMMNDAAPAVEADGEELVEEARAELALA